MSYVALLTELRRAPIELRRINTEVRRTLLSLAAPPADELCHSPELHRTPNAHCTMHIFDSLWDCLITVVAGTTNLLFLRRTFNINGL